MDTFNGEALNFNAEFRLKRAVDQLIGICAGISADGEVNDGELSFLSTWLSENSPVCDSFPGRQLADRVSSILSDGVVTADERVDLLEVLKQISGNRFSETGSALPDAAAIPAEKDPAIVFENRHFCFTGKFAYGTRKKCSDATAALGGIADPDVTKCLNYLVLGVEVSKDWKHSSYGRKIEKALHLKASGTPIVIVSESDWVLALSSESPA